MMNKIEMFLKNGNTNRNTADRLRYDKSTTKTEESESLWEY